MQHGQHRTHLESFGKYRINLAIACGRFVFHLRLEQFAPEKGVSEQTEWCYMPVLEAQH